MHDVVYIALGSNLGDRASYLAQAREQIAAITGVAVIAESSVYETPAAEMTADAPSFLNQVIQCRCSLTPEALLDKLEGIELAFGRKHEEKGKHFSRTIDLDILLFGDQIRNSDQLMIPHPNMLARPFVLVPLLELDRTIIHPITRRPIADSLTAEFMHAVQIVHPWPTGTHG